MDPKAKKVVDAAMVWTDNPSPANAGAIKSAVRGYREALKKEKAREAPKPAAKKVSAKKKASGTPPGVTLASPSFDTSDTNKEDK